MSRIAVFCLIFHVSLAAAAPLSFRHQEIESDFGIGYAVLVDDVNADGKPDIIAINETQAVWWENPTWEKHVVLDRETEKDNVCIAAHDIDRDGDLDLALGAAWRPSDTKTGGTLQWIGPQGSPKLPWTVLPLGFEPTLHRIRWGDTDGDGEMELIVAPLHGRGTSGPKHWEGAGARLLVKRPPKNAEEVEWPEEVADDTFHILHNFWVANLDDDPADELLTASYEGVHLLDRSRDGAWTRTRLGAGYEKAGDDQRGAGEIKLGRLKSGKRYISTIEPWHANHAVIYLEPADIRKPWQRKVLTDQLGGGHALWSADLDGDGDEELAVGWRTPGTGDFAKPGVAVFDPGDWSYQVIDSGGMATEDLTIADLNADGRPDIVAAGRATHNVKIYWNEK